MAISSPDFLDATRRPATEGAGLTARRAAPPTSLRRRGRLEAIRYANRLAGPPARRGAVFLPLVPGASRTVFRRGCCPPLLPPEDEALRHAERFYATNAAFNAHFLLGQPDRLPLPPGAGMGNGLSARSRLQPRTKASSFLRPFAAIFGKPGIERARPSGLRTPCPQAERSFAQTALAALLSGGIHGNAAAIARAGGGTNGCRDFARAVRPDLSAPCRDGVILPTLGARRRPPTLRSALRPDPSCRGDAGRDGRARRHGTLPPPTMRVEVEHGGPDHCGAQPTRWAF